MLYFVHFLHKRWNIHLKKNQINVCCILGNVISFPATLSESGLCAFHFVRWAGNVILMEV